MGTLVVLIVDVTAMTQFYKGNLMIITTKGVTKFGQEVQWTKFFKGSKGMYAASSMVRSQPEGSSVIVRGRLKDVGYDGEDV